MALGNVVRTLIFSNFAQGISPAARRVTLFLPSAPAVEDRRRLTMAVSGIGRLAC